MGNSFDLYQKERNRIVSGMLDQLLVPDADPETYVRHLQSTFNKTKKGPTDKITRSILEKGLKSSDETPHNHLNWNPAIRSELLGQQLRRQLREQKDEIENRLPGVIIIRVHSQVA